MALITVQDYITEARRLLQDTVAPYRYAESSFIEALSTAMLEARKMRPDLFLGRATLVPEYSSTSQSVVFEPMYRPALTYYVAGRVLLADREDADEARAGAFITKFTTQLLTLEG